MIKASIICDSLNPAGVRLTTFIVTYHRFIHAEHLRHRMQSFNVSSSRAIPGEKMANLVVEANMEPVFWGKNQSGMQAREELDIVSKQTAQSAWRTARRSMLNMHAAMLEIGVHKQLANRLLEPWMPVTVLCSATDWANFFKLRSQEDAQPEFQALSDSMLYCYCNSKPKALLEGDWHIPFGDCMDPAWDLTRRLKVATARCARLSYLTFDGKISTEADETLHDRLLESRHMSPFEHCAESHGDTQYYGNFCGWRPYRKTLDNECWRDGAVDLKELLRERQAAGSLWAKGHFDAAV